MGINYYILYYGILLWFVGYIVVVCCIMDDQIVLYIVLWMIMYYSIYGIVVYLIYCILVCIVWMQWEYMGWFIIWVGGVYIYDLL